METILKCECGTNLFKIKYYTSISGAKIVTKLECSCGASYNLTPVEIDSSKSVEVSYL